MVEDLARERKEAEHRATAADPMGADGDADPVLLHEQSQHSDQLPKSLQPSRSWVSSQVLTPSVCPAHYSAPWQFRGSVVGKSRNLQREHSHPDIGPPVPIRSSVKGNGRLGRGG